MPKKPKTTPIETIYLPKKKRPKKLNLQCIRCDKELEMDAHGGYNAEPYPIVYDGVVFRSSGQYGSTVLDCGVGIPEGYSDQVQVILCDDCIKKLGNRLNMWTEARDVMLEHTDKWNKGLRRVAKWADYVTFNDVQKASKNAEPVALGEAAKWKRMEKAGLGEEAQKLREDFYSMLRETTATFKPEASPQDQPDKKSSPRRSKRSKNS